MRHHHLDLAATVAVVFQRSPVLTASPDAVGAEHGLMVTAYRLASGMGVLLTGLMLR